MSERESASLWGVTSMCSEPGQRVPGLVVRVWSVHISRIPCYAGLITLASSGARSALIGVGCLQLTHFFYSRSQPSLSSVSSVIQHSLLYMCVCTPPSCGSDLSFHLDQTRGGGVCFSLIGTCYWLTVVLVQTPLSSPTERKRRHGGRTFCVIHTRKSDVSQRVRRVSLM